MSEQTKIEVGGFVRINETAEIDCHDATLRYAQVNGLYCRVIEKWAYNSDKVIVEVGGAIGYFKVTELELVAPAAPALDSQAELIALRAERDALIAALREARDSLLDIRDLSAPYDCRDNPPGFEFSRIFSHAEYGLRHSEAAAKQHGMEKGKRE